MHDSSEDDSAMAHAFYSDPASSCPVVVSTDPVIGVGATGETVKLYHVYEITSDGQPQRTLGLFSSLEDACAWADWRTTQHHVCGCRMGLDMLTHMRLRVHHEWLWGVIEGLAVAALLYIGSGIWR